MIDKIKEKIEQRVDSLVDDAAERLGRDQAEADKHKIHVLNVWLRWEIDPKTKRRGALLGVHSTLRGAQLAMPKEFQELAHKYPPDSPYIQNFLNKAITRMVLED